MPFVLTEHRIVHVTRHSEHLSAILQLDVVVHRANRAIDGGRALRFVSAPGCFPREASDSLHEHHAWPYRSGSSREL